MNEVDKVLRNCTAVHSLKGESFMVSKVYKICPVSICDHCTQADLTKLDMMEFDVIMGVDWLASCYARVDRQGVSLFRTLRLVE